MKSKFESKQWFCKDCKIILDDGMPRDVGPFAETDDIFNKTKFVHRDCKGWQRGIPEPTVEEQFTKKANQLITPESLKKAIAQSKKMFSVKSKGKSFSVQLLDHEIRKLTPITLLDDGTRMILVFLPVQIREELKEELGEPEYVNKAFFVSYDGKQKRLIPSDATELKEKFKISVLPFGYDLRWNLTDLNAWVDESNPTEPKKVYETINKTIRYYLDLESEHDYVFQTLWDIGTYFYQLFNAFPYKDLTGLKRVGKTKVLEIDNLICYNSNMTADITGPSLFRTIEGLGSTLPIDETESFKKTKNEQAQHVRTLLLEGFLRDKKAIRTESRNDTYVPTTYDLYAPKSFGHIKAFDDILEDRCIEILMKRSKNREKLNTWPTNDDGSFTQIRNLCYRLFLDYAHEIHDIIPQAKQKLSVSGRELQQWTAIMSLAIFFEKHGINGLVQNVTDKTALSSEQRQIQDEEESKELRILQYLDDSLESHIEQGQNIKGKMLISKIYSDLIKDDNKRKYQINPDYYSKTSLSNDLHRLGFKKTRLSAGIFYMINRESINDSKQRLGMNVDEKQVTLD